MLWAVSAKDNAFRYAQETNNLCYKDAYLFLGFTINILQRLEFVKSEPEFGYTGSFSSPININTKSSDLPVGASCARDLPSKIGKILKTK